MKPEKTYRLWTFQSDRSVGELKTNGILEARWDRYSQTDPMLRAYQWMVKQIVARNITGIIHAPIWAWHSCGRYANGPKLVDARCLLSDIELNAGIQVIEFECPAELAVLSCYGAWNMVLDKYFYSKDNDDVDNKSREMLFETNRRRLKKHDSIQATLPYLKLDWVKAIKRLNLEPGDFTYDPEEEC